MKNKFFKFNENYAKVIRHLDDRQAGQYVRAISDYAFEGKTYGGKDTAVKTAFTLTKQMIDDEKFYREKGRLGGQKIAERKRTDDGQIESDTMLKSVTYPNGGIITRTKSNNIRNWILFCIMQAEN